MNTNISIDVQNAPLQAVYSLVHFTPTAAQLFMSPLLSADVHGTPTASVHRTPKDKIMYFVE